MKTLTHYFKSPEEASFKHLNNQTSPSNVDQNISQNKTPEDKEKSKKSKKKSRKDKDLLESSNVDNGTPHTLTSDSEKTTNARIKKKNKKSKHNEEKILLTNNTSNLLNNSADDFEPSPFTKANDNTEKQNVKAAQSTKPNAFQVMMESRHKSIGRNSPGKDIKDDPEDVTTKRSKKEMLSVRKNLLQEWADKKGGVKRKREEEETEIVIKKKLEKRKRRMKKLLDNCEQNEDTEDEKVLIKTRKKIVKIASDSEESRDGNCEISTVVENKNEKRKNRKRVRNINEIEKESDASDFNVQENQVVLKEVFSNEDSNIESVVAEKNVFEIESKEDTKQREAANFLGLFNRSFNGKKKEAAMIENKNQKTSVISEIAIEDSVVSLKEIFSNEESDVDDVVEKTVETKEHDKQKEAANFLGLFNQNWSSKKKKPLTLAVSQGEHEVIKVKMFSPKSSKNKPRKARKTTESEEISALNSHLKEEDSCNSVLEVTDSLLDESSNDSVLLKIKKGKTELTDTPSKRAKNPWKMRVKLLDSENENEISSDSIPEKEKLSITVSSDESDTEPSQDIKKPVKLAPIFIKSTPKPKIDASAIEAKRNFLFSGIPESLKKTIEKRTLIENVDFDVFPKISHVQQKSEGDFWNLPRVSLELNAENSPFKFKNVDFSLGTLCKSKESNSTKDYNIPPKVTNITQILKKIKADYPEYPIYKTFRLLSEKSPNNTKKLNEENSTAAKPRRGRPKKNKPPEKPTENTDNKTEVHFSMWTEKYKPRSSEDILENQSAIKELKNWLLGWVEYTKELSEHKAKRKRKNSSSSEFEGEDSDSRSSSIVPDNAVVVCGPVGCGKTSAIYALCNELDINVLELNASSKRTGKRVLQELQEATQSHQVKKAHLNPIAAMLKPTKTKKPPERETETKKSQKMSLLLVEDVDIVFEQDEGFTTSLVQLLSTSKRPVVLVTSDKSCNHVQRFTNNHKVVRFSSVRPKTFATHLQLLCLKEGLHVDRAALRELLEHNMGDARRALMQLQFWAQTGGQCREVVKTVLERDKKSSFEEFEVFNDDDNSNLSYLGEETIKGEGSSGDEFIHVDCLRHNFESHEYCDKFSLPYDLTLETLWWNIPSLMGFNTTSKKAAEEKIHDSNEEKSAELFKLQSVTNVLDAISIADVLGKETLSRMPGCNTKLKDSLELKENLCGYSESEGVTEQLCHAALELAFNARTYDNCSDLKMNYGLPDTEHKRWYNKRQFCDKTFACAVPSSSRIHKRALVSDYLPVLRCISKSERERSAANTKRGNRFYNYLQSLGVDCNSDVLEVSCSVFNDDDLT